MKCPTKTEGIPKDRLDEWVRLTEKQRKDKDFMESEGILVKGMCDTEMELKGRTTAYVLNEADYANATKAEFYQCPKCKNIEII